MVQVKYLLCCLLLCEPFNYRFPDPKPVVVVKEPEPKKESTTVPVVDQTKVRRLLHFTATWCGPCKTYQTPALEEMKKVGWKIGKPGTTAHIWSYDWDESPTVLAKYKVDQVPTFILVDGNGKVIHRLTGIRTSLELNKLLTYSPEKK